MLQVTEMALSMLCRVSVLNIFLRRDIVGLDQWFANVKEMFQYIRFRNDEGMAYLNIDPKVAVKARSEKRR